MKLGLLFSIFITVLNVNNSFRAKLLQSPVKSVFSQNHVDIIQNHKMSNTIHQLLSILLPGTFHLQSASWCQVGH